MDVLALYDWGGAFDVGGYPARVPELTQGLGVEPNKVTVSTLPNGKEYKGTVSKNVGILDIIGRHKGIEWISLDQIEGGNFLDPKFHLLIHEGNRRQYVVGCNTAGRWMLTHLERIGKYVAPAYGFAVRGSAPTVLFYVSGIGASSMSFEERRRADILMKEIILRKRHLEGFFHDLYEFNVITSMHTEKLVDGTSLSYWLRTGNWGEVISIGEDAYVWIVPMAIRRDIRQKLIDSRLILVALA